MRAISSSFGLFLKCFNRYVVKIIFAYILGDKVDIAIVNVGKSEIAEALVEDVHRLLISPYVPCLFWWDTLTTQWYNSTSQSFIKKKAVLTLLKLYRKHLEVIPSAEWALRIVFIMDDHDLVIILAIIFFFFN